MTGPELALADDTLITHGKRRMEASAPSSSGPRTIIGMERSHDGLAKPQKRFFRQRAHINPLSISGSYLYPVSPDRMDWSKFYPREALTAPDGSERRVTVADVGCGFGGLLMALSPVMTSTLILGLEIRPRVSEYVRLRLLSSRRAGSCLNASVMVTNAMKLLPFYFNRAQLECLFFCFPDPHWKRNNHRRRIVSTALLDEYVHLLREGGVLYTITDVPDLNAWMAAHCDAHPYLNRVSEAELESDPLVRLMFTSTEEGIKVERNSGFKLAAVFRRSSREQALRKADLNFWSERRVDYTPLHARAGSSSAGGASSSTGGVKRAREAVQVEEEED